MQQQAYEWVAGAINALPDISATQEDRQKACQAMAVAAAAPSAGTLATNTNAMRWDSTTLHGRASFNVHHLGRITNNFMLRYDRQVDDAIEELSDLCRRNRRSYQAAQLALLPPELALVANGQ